MDASRIIGALTPFAAAVYMAVGTLSADAGGVSFVAALAAFGAVPWAAPSLP